MQNIVYDYSGVPVITLNAPGSSFYDNMSVWYYKDNTANTRYRVIRIFKKKLDGTFQYPFVRIIPNVSDRVSAQTLSNQEGWNLVINCGCWEGPRIENSVLISDEAPYSQPGACLLTINSNGDLGYVANVVGGEGNTLLQQGIVSASYYFFPLIVDYENYNYPTDIPNTFGNHEWEIAQKQIIGQYENGDYCIITTEGRGYANSTGFTMAQVQALCKNMGLKFAFNLDGGGSTQTVIGEKQINLVYEGSSGRVLPGFIVFNGTNTFSIPNNT